MKLAHAIKAAAFVLGAGMLAPGLASAQCNVDNLQAGLNRDCTVQVGGMTREFDVRVPRDRSSITTVMVDSHGFTSTKEGQARLSGLTALVDSMGVVLINDQGIANSHNSGNGQNFRGNRCCGTALSQNVDDIGFIQAAVTAVESSLGLKRDDIVRVQAGLSNGGAQTNFAFCTIGEFFDVYAPVSFPLPADLQGCQAAEGTIYNEFHGSADTLVNPAGSDALNSRKVTDIQSIAELRGCDMQPQMSQLNRNTTCQTFTGCDGGGSVGMCLVEGGPHVLYGSIARPDNFPVAVGRMIEQARELKQAR